MPSVDITDETQLETQDETQFDESNDAEDQDREIVNENATARSKNKKELAVEFVREPGKSLLPFARVQKIIKADKEITIVAKDATFLISLATEEFIKQLCEAGRQVAQREKRSTVQHRDIAAVVRRADEFLFLEEIMAWTSSDPPETRQKSIKSTLLEQYVNKNDKGVDDDGDDIVMNEDGTMYAAAGSSADGEHDSA